MLGYEIRVTTQPVACAFDLNNDSMVLEPIQQRGRDDRIAEDVSPFCKAPIGGQDHGPFFVSGVDELEEQIAAPVGDGQIPDLINDQQ